MKASLKTMKTALLRGFHALGGGDLLRTVSHRRYCDWGGRIPRLNRRPSASFQILYYHRINDQNDPFSIGGVRPGIFAQHMEYLRRNYSVLSLDELWSRTRARDLPPDALAVTFDDGYADSYVYAFPILKRYQIPATVFIVTASIGTNQPLWFDRVLSAFKFTSASAIDLDAAGRSLRWSDTDERSKTALWTLRYLRGLPDEMREASIADITRQLNPALPSNPWPAMLDWRQVGEMREAGIRFGSHTATHPILSRCTPERVRTELQDSRRKLEQELGEEIPTFAYPSGRLQDFDESTRGMVAAAGFKVAVTVLSRCNYANSDPLTWGRFASSAKSVPHFAFEVAYSKLMDGSPHAGILPGGSAST